MKIKFTLILGIMTLANLSFAQAKLSKDQSEVYNTIVLIGTSWAENRIDTLEKYITKDYLHTDVAGQALTKDAWINQVKERMEKGVKFPGLEFEDIDIRVSGDFAFVTGINIFSGQVYAGDSNVKRKLRFTQVLRKENKVWKRFLFQATYITSAK